MTQTRERALEAFNFIERKLSVGLDESGYPEFADMDTHYAMSVLYRAALMLPSVRWMPIESAPRDGTHFEAYDINRKYRAIVYFVSGEWEEVDGYGRPKGIGFYPTHWMPLPAAPKAGA